MYSAAQGLVARQYQLDVIANNIANVNTTGFRETSPFFRSYNKALDEGPFNPMNAAANNQPVVAGTFLHSHQGAIKSTGHTLDLAISGEGYFKVETGSGVRYTRNGDFEIRPQNGSSEVGELITSSGHPVLDISGQPVTISLSADQTHINREGFVVQDGVQQNQIALVTFADKTGLIPEEDTLLFNQNPVAQEIAAGGEIRSGYLETSNVNIAKQMVDMVRAQRAYETNIRTIRTVDTNMNQQVIQGFAAR
jgi:flagellar basal-body rod protein FlgF